MESVAFGLLGPVDVLVSGRSPAALSPSLRVLLARLALSPGRVVSADALTDALWGEDLPADASNALQIRGVELRRPLVAAGVPNEVLLTKTPGYVLAVQPEAVDAYGFEQLLARARRLLVERKRAEALVALDQALALWRGAALGDGDADWIEAERPPRVAPDRGPQGPAGAPARPRPPQRGRRGPGAARHPAPSARAPAPAADGGAVPGGRQADALTLYHRLRSRLADELGIDPSLELQALAEAILRQQLPEPAAPRTPVAAPRLPTVPDADTAAFRDRAVPRPASAPPALSSIIGRRDDVDVVLGLLAHTRLVTLTGTGGVGKTTLALEVARHVDPVRAEAHSRLARAASPADHAFRAAANSRVARSASAAVSAAARSKASAAALYAPRRSARRAQDANSRGLLVGLGARDQVVEEG
jgi:DNA-binding SARP family transcriptional activator